MFKSANIIPVPYGITPHPTKAKNKDNIGAIQNIIKLA
jgi:hypothetical protein